MVVVVIADGYEKLSKEFKVFARKHKFLDETILEQKEFMVKNEVLDQDGNTGWKMRPISELMNENCNKAYHPENILHLF